jgi:hypothetical protein
VARLQPAVRSQGLAGRPACRDTGQVAAEQVANGTDPAVGEKAYQLQMLTRVVGRHVELPHRGKLGYASGPTTMLPLCFYGSNLVKMQFGQAARTRARRFPRWGEGSPWPGRGPGPGQVPPPCGTDRPRGVPARRQLGSWPPGGPRLRASLRGPAFTGPASGCHPRHRNARQARRAAPADHACGLASADRLHGTGLVGSCFYKAVHWGRR